MSLTAKVIRLAWRSLDMLDPAQVARDMRRPEQLVARLREAARPERRVVVVLQEDEKLFSVVLGALIALRDELEATWSSWRPIPGSSTSSRCSA